MSGQGGKSKRSSERAKALRARCRQTGQERKRLLDQIRHDQEIANRALVKAGNLTPWQEARAARAARREQAGVREQWLKSRKPEQFPAS